MPPFWPETSGETWTCPECGLEFHSGTPRQTSSEVNWHVYGGALDVVGWHAEWRRPNPNPEAAATA